MLTPTAALGLGDSVSSTAKYFGGKVVEVLVYNRALSTAERQQVENGLLTRYALSGTDADNDGLPDTWELQYLHTLAYSATDDPDGDGRTNLYEYQNGLDPLLRLDGFALPNGYQLVTPTPAGQFYGVSTSTWVISPVNTP